jgi:hypothetical protein
MENEIFEHYRKHHGVKNIAEAINLLLFHGYTIVDLEGEIVEEIDN